MREFWISAVMLVGAFGLMASAGTHREAPLVGSSKLPGTLAHLENDVGRNPSERAPLLQLGELYLERNAPGLAIAAIQRAPLEVQSAPEIAHVLGRAWLHEGQASQALAQQRAVLDACSAAPCSPWLIASASRQERFLSALIDRGIEDFRRDPDGTVAAYNATSGGSVALLDSAVADHVAAPVSIR